MNRSDCEPPGGWTRQRVLYEVGFRIALFCVLGALSSLIFFTGGAFGGAVDTGKILVLVSG